MCHLTCIIHLLARYEMGHFRKAVHYYKHILMTSLGLRQSLLSHKLQVGKKPDPTTKWRQLRDHLSTVTLSRCSHHFRGEVVTSRGGIPVTLGGKEMESVMYEWMPLQVKFLCVENGFSKVLMVAKSFQEVVDLVNVYCTFPRHKKDNDTNPNIWQKRKLRFLSLISVVNNSIYHKLIL